MHSMSTQDYLIVLIIAFSFNLLNGVLSVINLSKGLNTQQKSLTLFLAFKCILGMVLNFLLEGMLVTLCVLDLLKMILPIESSKQ